MRCSVRGCGKPLRARGLCSTHYAAMRRAGGGRVYERSGFCCVDDCGLPTHSKGMCDIHYRRVQRTGDPMRGRKPAQPKPPRAPKPTDEERFLAKTDRTGDCWLWVGYIATNGYGRFSLAHDRSVPAHRWAYEHWRGPVPDDLVMDHLCRVRHCVNPDHVEPVTQRENLVRGIGTKVNVTHCPAGHAYAGDNLYTAPSGARHCRICARVKKRERRAKLAADHGV